MQIKVNVPESKGTPLGKFPTIQEIPVAKTGDPRRASVSTHH